MKKRIWKMLLLAGMMVISPQTSYAYSAKDIADQSDLLYVSGSSIYSLPTTESAFWAAYERAVTGTLKACDASEAGSVRCKRSRDGYIFEITPAQIQTLIAHQEYTDQWLAETVPALIAPGLDRESVIQTVFLWIIHHYRYNFDISGDGSAAEKYQGVYPMITAIENGGICSSHSKLFRSMIEYIPFNSLGTVDYQTENPTYIKVSIVNNTELTHEWNAITDTDGTTWYYDLSAEAILYPSRRNTDISAPFRYYRLSEEEICRDQLHGRPGTFIFDR